MQQLDFFVLHDPWCGLRGGNVDYGAEDVVVGEELRVFFFDANAVLNQHDGGVGGDGGLDQLWS